MTSRSLDVVALLRSALQAILDVQLVKVYLCPVDNARAFEALQGHAMFALIIGMHHAGARQSPASSQPAQQVRRRHLPPN